MYRTISVRLVRAEMNFDLRCSKIEANCVINSKHSGTKVYVRWLYSTPEK